MAAAVSDHGYQGVRLADLAARARTSLATLYENFGGKEGLFLAAFDALTSRALAVSEKAFAGGPDWSEAMRAVNRELFSYLASEPELTRLALVEVLGAGREALAARDLMLKPFAERLMRGGYELAPEAPKIAAEACALAVYTAAGRWIKSEGARSLASLVPLATFIELAPFLGAPAAAGIADADASPGGSVGAPEGDWSPTRG
jgi:AcrR family transcriptional regulator